MKSRTLISLILYGLSIIAFFSCNASETPEDEEKVFELQERERELDKREMAIKIKEQELDSIQQSILKSKPVPKIRNTNKEEKTENHNKPSKKSKLTIGEFSKLPDQFAIGAGSLYSKTKNGKPVFVDDVAGNAVMIINNKLVRLKWVEKRIYADETYNVSVETEIISSGHESTEEHGFIIIKSKDGSLLKLEVWGGFNA